MNLYIYIDKSQSAASCCQLRAPASANAKTKPWPAFATSKRCAAFAHTKNAGVGDEHHPIHVDGGSSCEQYQVKQKSPPRLLAGILICRFIFLFIFHFYALEKSKQKNVDPFISELGFASLG
jgi:hypothetical protein